MDTCAMCLHESSCYIYYSKAVNKHFNGEKNLEQHVKEKHKKKKKSENQ